MNGFQTGPQGEKDSTNGASLARQKRRVATGFSIPDLSWLAQLAVELYFSISSQRNFPLNVSRLTFEGKSVRNEADKFDRRKTVIRVKMCIHFVSIHDNRFLMH